MDKLANERIEKLIMSFSLPAVVGIIVSALNNIVDRIFVGRGLGSTALSGVSVTFPITTIIGALGALVGIGATSLVSLKLGEKKADEAEKVIGNSLILGLLLSIIPMAVGYGFMKSILVGFGASSEVLPYAKEFTQVILIGTFFQIASFSLNSIIRGEGNPKRAFLTMVACTVINLTLNPFFIFVLHMGIRGSALATVLANFSCAVWVFFYFIGKQSLLKFQLKKFTLEFDMLKRLCVLGTPAFLMQLITSMILIVANRNLETYGGNAAVAAMGVIYSIYSLVFMIIYGISQGVQPIIGYNYGAGLFDRVKKALIFAVILSTGVCTFFYVILMVFTRGIIKIFCDNPPELISIATSGLRLFFLALPVIGIQIIAISYFQAIGKPKQSLILTLFRQLIILIPLMMILPKFFNINGLWVSFAISDAVSFLLAGILLKNNLSKFDPKDNSLKV
ncbi:MAG TPA: MATE family efflux transporter [Ruminiclostridium sp.]|nr:MATE family efflux transporter [Ruminiclostridium sp.]